jgi:hypothetical protein
MSEPEHVPSLDEQRVRSGQPREQTGQPREQIRDRLLAQAHLFDDPVTYRSGVLDALAAMEEAE